MTVFENQKQHLCRRANDHKGGNCGLVVAQNCKQYAAQYRQDMADLKSKVKDNKDDPICGDEADKQMVQPMETLERQQN